MQTHIPFLEARERSRFLKLFWTEKETLENRSIQASGFQAFVYPDEGRSVLEVELETSNTRPWQRSFLAPSCSATTSNAV